MIAMQYRFVLPADYDMDIIDRRITEKGPLLDHLPNLKLKAYLTAKRISGSLENLYAPFYVWNRDEGLSDFLCSDVFVGLTRSFGWPQVETWIVWQAQLSENVLQARFATSEIRTTAPHAAL